MTAPFNDPQQPAGQPAQPQVVHHVVHQPPAGAKDVTIAYVLWFFLGGLGIDRFYLRRPVEGVLMIVLNVLSFCGLYFVIGVVGYIGLFVWWIVNACLIPGQVRACNGQVAPVAPAPPYAG